MGGSGWGEGEVIVGRGVRGGRLGGCGEGVQGGKLSPGPGGLLCLPCLAQGKGRNTVSTPQSATAHLPGR